MTDEVAETLRRPAGRDDEKRRGRDRAARCSATRSRWPPRRPRWARCSRPRPTRTRRRSARGSPTASRRPSPGPPSPGRPTASGRARATRSARRCRATPTRRHEALDVPLRRLIRVYLANRGVWEAIIGAGPTCAVPATRGRRRRLRRRVRIADRGAHVVTPPPRIEIIRVAGANHREVGRQLGEAARDRIHAEAAQAFDDLPAGRTVDQQRALGAGVPRVHRATPALARRGARRHRRGGRRSIRSISSRPRSRRSGTSRGARHAGTVQRRRRRPEPRPPTATCSSATRTTCAPPPRSTSSAIEKQVAGDPSIFQLGGVPWLSRRLELRRALAHRQRALPERRAARHLPRPPGARDDAGAHARRDGGDGAPARPRVELQQRAHERRRRRRERRGKRHRRRGHRPRRRRAPRAHEPLRLRSDAPVRGRSRLRGALGDPVRTGPRADRRPAAGLGHDRDDARRS